MKRNELIEWLQNNGTGDMEVVVPELNNNMDMDELPANVRVTDDNKIEIWGDE